MQIEFPKSAVPSIWTLYWDRVKRHPHFKFYLMAAVCLVALFTARVFSKTAKSGLSYAQMEMVTRPENLSKVVKFCEKMQKELSTVHSFEGLLAQNLLISQADSTLVQKVYKAGASHTLPTSYSALYEKLGEISLLIQQGKDEIALNKSLTLLESDSSEELYLNLIIHSLAKKMDKAELVHEKAERIQFLLFNPNSPLTQKEKQFWLSTLGQDPAVIQHYYS